MMKLLGFHALFRIIFIFLFLLLKALLTYKSLTQKEKLIENNLKYINTMKSDTHKEDNVIVTITYKGQNAELN